MTKREAIKVCKEMNKWRRASGPYADTDKRMPYSPFEFGQAIDKLIEIAENKKV